MMIYTFFLKFDEAVVAKELAMTDSEHSDAEVSYTENGTFNLSRGQTPLTEGSEGMYTGEQLLFNSFCLVLKTDFATFIHFDQILTDTVMQKNHLRKTFQTFPL